MQKDVGSSQLGRAGVASFTCTAREELGGLPLRDRTRNPLPAPIAHTSRPIHAFKGRDCSKKPTQRAVRSQRQLPSPEGRGREVVCSSTSITP